MGKSAEKMARNRRLVDAGFVHVAGWVPAAAARRITATIKASAKAVAEAERGKEPAPPPPALPE